MRDFKDLKRDLLESLMSNFGFVIKLTFFKQNYYFLVMFLKTFSYFPCNNKIKQQQIKIRRPDIWKSKPILNGIF